MNNEQFLLRYLDALENGDVETMERLLWVAQDDARLSRQLEELHAAYESEALMNGFHEGEKIMQLSIPLVIRPQTRQRSTSVLLSMIAAVVTLFFVGIVLAVQPISNDSQPATPQFSLTDLQPITTENVDQLTPLMTLGNGAVYSVAWSPDGETMAVGSTAGIFLHDVDDLTTVPKQLNPQPIGVHLRYSGDGSYIVAQSFQTITIWDTETGEQVQNFPVEDQTVYDLFVSNDGSRVAARICLRLNDRVRWVCEDHVVLVWDVVSGEVLETISLSEHSNSYLLPIALSPDLTKLVFTSGRGIYVIDIDTQKSSRSEIELAGTNVTAMQFSPDGSNLAFAMDQVAGRIRVEEFNEIMENAVSADAPTAASRSYFEQNGSIVAMVFREEDEQVLGVERDGGFVVYDVKENKNFYTDETLGERANYIFIDPSGERFATLNDYLQVWSTEDGSEIAFLNDLYNPPYDHLSFSGDGHTLAASGWSSGVDYWDLTSSSPVRQQWIPEIDGESVGVILPVLNEDGSKVAYQIQLRQTNSEELEVYDLEQNEVVSNTTSNQSYSLWNSPVFLEDDTLLWFLRRFEITRIDADGASGVTEIQVNQQVPPNTSLRNAFSPDGRLLALATCKEENEQTSLGAPPIFDCLKYQVGVWDALQGNRLIRLSEIEAPIGWSGEIVFSTDGRTLGASYCSNPMTLQEGNSTFYDCAEHEIQLWDLAPLYERWVGETESTNVDMKIPSTVIRGEGYQPRKMTINNQQGTQVVLATTDLNAPQVFQINLGSDEVTPITAFNDVEYSSSVLFNRQNTLLAVSKGGQITLYGIPQ